MTQILYQIAISAKVVLGLWCARGADFSDVIWHNGLISKRTQLTSCPMEFW